MEMMLNRQSRSTPIDFLADRGFVQSGFNDVLLPGVARACRDRTPLNPQVFRGKPPSDSEMMAPIDSN